MGWVKLFLCRTKQSELTIMDIYKNGSKSFYFKDHLGSVRTRVNASGTVQEVMDFDPFGLDMAGRGMLSGIGSATKFTGYERDPESFLDYAQARYYNPMIGRFMSVDPLAEQFPSWSAYAYVMNNPIGLVDPTGLSAEDPKAMTRAVLNGALSLGAMVTGYAAAITGGALTVPTGGVTATVALGGLAVGSLGSAGLALAIADYNIALNTPDGMTADSFGNLASTVAKGLGLAESSQEAIGIAQDIATGGGLIRAGKLIVDDRILEAALQVEGLMNSTRNWIEAYIDEKQEKSKENDDSNEN
jgi:RHS repeat-associated protein